MIKDMVSVIVPVYNEKKYIDKFINSLINQDYPTSLMEWILIDGNSNDGTLDVVNKYINDYPIKILHNDKRLTPISVNMGIKESKGEYIVRMDCHSEFPKEYISKCIDTLIKTGADNVGGVAITESQGFIGNAISKVLSSKFGVGDSTFRTNGKSGYVDTVPFGTFKRDIFDKLGYFNEELIRSEDNDFNSRIIVNGGKIYLNSDIKFVYYSRDNISSLLKMALMNGNALFFTFRINRSAMRLRHFIPFLFFLSIVLLPILGIFNKIFSSLFFLELIAYFILDFVFSFLNKEFKYGIITIWLYPLFHFIYGLGSFLSLLKIKVY